MGPRAYLIRAQAIPQLLTGNSGALTKKVKDFSLLMKVNFFKKNYYEGNITIVLKFAK